MLSSSLKFHLKQLLTNFGGQKERNGHKVRVGFQQRHVELCGAPGCDEEHQRRLRDLSILIFLETQDIGLSSNTHAVVYKLLCFLLSDSPIIILTRPSLETSCISALSASNTLFQIERLLFHGLSEPLHFHRHLRNLAQNVSILAMIQERLGSCEAQHPAAPTRTTK